MKIAILAHCAAQGGSEKVSVLLANYFVEHGYEVYFFAVHYDEIQYYMNPNIHYQYSNINTGNRVLKQLKRIIAVRKFVRYIKPDVVLSMVNIESIGLIGMNCFRKVCSLRNDPNRYYNTGIKKVLRTLAYNDADAIVFQTKEAQEYFPSIIALKGSVIANPIQEALPYWEENSEKRYVMTACRLNAQKNLTMMVHAFKIFHDVYPNYELRIYGVGEKEPELREIVKTLSLDKFVKFMGNCANIHAEMKRASLFLLSSDYEGISNSMLEALAIGVPCVCTDCPVGGARMFIEEGKNGCLAPVGDARKFAEKMIVAIGDFTNVSTKSLANKIRRELAMDYICNKWEKVIKGTL